MGTSTGSGLGSSVLFDEEGFSRFIKFKLGDFNVGWVDWDWHLGTILLVSNNLINVDAPSSSVDGGDLSGFTFNTSLFGSALDKNSVSLSNWDRFAIILGSEFLAQWSAHHLSSETAWGSEVSLSRLSSLG